MASITRAFRRWRRWIFFIVAFCLAIGVITAAYAAWNYVSLFPPHAPNDADSHAISEDELRDHVEYLADPALKGRMPLSMGSAVARDYLVSRFEALGLAPWGDAASFEQSVKFGTNVIGVLPGGDESLADEIIVVSAHYDHIGGDRLGACDNASGVAVLLECAERLALAEERPRRPICFAAFDSEERGLWGAMAFTCRGDFDAERIGAVVNVDMLGRRFMDVFEKTLFVSGTGLTEAVQAHLQTSATAQGTTLLPVGVRFVGPRSDHAALDTLGIPSLFFSCGLYPDYHTEADTVDKLVFSEVADSAEIVAKTVEQLAGFEGALGEFIEPTPQVPAELETQRHLIREAVTKHRTVFTEPQLKAAELLLAKLDAYIDLPPEEQSSDSALIVEALTLMLPIAEGASANNAEDESGERDDSEIMQLGRKREALSALMYARHGDFILGEYRALANRILDTPMTAIFWNGIDQGTFVSRCTVQEEDVRLVENGATWSLDVLLTPVRAHWKLEPLLSAGTFVVDARPVHFDWSGTREELVAAHLMRWTRYRRACVDTEYHRTRLARRGEPAEEVERGVQWLSDESRLASWDESLARVMAKVSGETLKADCEAWRDWWFEKNGIGSEQEWVERLLQSTNTYVLEAAIDSMQWVGEAESRDGVMARIAEIAQDSSHRDELRLDAAAALLELAGPDALQTVAELLVDNTPIESVDDKERRLTEAFYAAYPNHELAMAGRYYEAVAEAHEKERHGNGDNDETGAEDETLTIGECVRFMAEQLVERLPDESGAAYAARFVEAVSEMPRAERVVMAHDVTRVDPAIWWADGKGFAAPWAL